MQQNMSAYHGCGNSFVITKYESSLDNPEKAKMICQNMYDGFILVKENPLEMVIYNQDGSLADMCGNGIRCFIHYCYNQKIINQFVNYVLTGSGIVRTIITSVHPFMVKVFMNEEQYTYLGKIYFPIRLDVNRHHYDAYLMNTGVWHVVLFPTCFEEAIDDAFDIFYLPMFKQKFNIDFVKNTNGQIYVKTYERGVGFTKACGTGVMATYLTLKKINNNLENEVEIKTDGGIICAGKSEDGPFIIGPSICTKINNK